MRKQSESGRGTDRQKGQKRDRQTDGQVIRQARKNEDKIRWKTLMEKNEAIKKEKDRQLVVPP